MIRLFCDGCNRDVTNHKLPKIAENDPISRWKGKIDVNGNTPLLFEIVTGRDGTWNVGDRCVHCIYKAIHKSFLAAARDEDVTWSR